MVNKVILVGNLGRDPEVRAMPSGDSVTEFSIATTRKWKNRTTNELKEETEWHNIVVFGRQAETAGQYLRKGKQVYVEGRLRTRSWEDRNSGEKKYRTEVVCLNFQMLGRKGDSDGSYGGGGGYGGPSQGGSQPPSQGGSQPEAPPFNGPDDDDIPF